MSALFFELLTLIVVAGVFFSMGLEVEDIEHSVAARVFQTEELN